MTDQLFTKTGDNLNRAIADRLVECYLQLYEPVGEYNEPFLRGSILAYKKILEKLGLHAELEVKIVENTK